MRMVRPYDVIGPRPLPPLPELEREAERLQRAIASLAEPLGELARLRPRSLDERALLAVTTLGLIAERERLTAELEEIRREIREYPRA